MSVTPESIKAFAPELSTLDDEDDVQPAIDMAERRTNRKAWASKADDAVTYLVCHMLTLAARIAVSGAQARGPLTSETVGPLSRSFAVPGSVTLSSAYLASTTYGQAYAELRSGVFSDRVGTL